MSSASGISALYSEFTDTLAEVLAGNAVGPVRRGRTRRRQEASRLQRVLDIFWRSKRHSKIGKPYKTPVARTALAVGATRGAPASGNGPVAERVLAKVQRQIGLLAWGSERPSRAPARAG